MTQTNRSSKLPLEWSKHLPAKDRKDFEAAVRHSTLVLGRLDELIQDRLDSIDQTESNRDTYENPAYGYMQAHLNGRKAALKDLKQLLAFLT